jgi:hypothetical protein
MAAYHDCSGDMENDKYWVNGSFKTKTKIAPEPKNHT